MRNLSFLSLLCALCASTFLLASCKKEGEKKENVLIQQFDTANRATLERTKGSMNKIAAALASYMSDNGQYPVGEGFSETAAKLSSYDPMLQLQDVWHNNFQYFSTGESYTLTSGGADGQIGTEDDLVMKDGQFARLPKVARPGG